MSARAIPDRMAIIAPNMILARRFLTVHDGTGPGFSSRSFFRYLIARMKPVTVVQHSHFAVAHSLSVLCLGITDLRPHI